MKSGPIYKFESPGGWNLFSYIQSAIDEFRIRTGKQPRRINLPRWRRNEWDEASMAATGLTVTSIYAGSFKEWKAIPIVWHRGTHISLSA